MKAKTGQSYKVAHSVVQTCFAAYVLVYSITAKIENNNNTQKPKTIAVAMMVLEIPAPES